MTDLMISEGSTNYRMVAPSRLVCCAPRTGFIRTPEKFDCLRRQRFRNFVPHILSQLGKFGFCHRRNTIYVVQFNIRLISEQFVMELCSISLEDSCSLKTIVQMRTYQSGRCRTAPVLCALQVNPGLDFDFPPICTLESSSFTAFPKTSPDHGAP